MSDYYRDEDEMGCQCTEGCADCRSDVGVTVDTWCGHCEDHAQISGSGPMGQTITVTGNCHRCHAALSRTATVPTF